jgi:HAMP domain-containing protein
MNKAYRLLPSLIIYGVLFAAVFLLVLAILEEREQGSLDDLPADEIKRRVKP